MRTTASDTTLDTLDQITRRADADPDAFTREEMASAGARVRDEGVERIERTLDPGLDRAYSGPMFPEPRTTYTLSLDMLAWIEREVTRFRRLRDRAIAEERAANPPPDVPSEVPPERPPCPPAVL